MSAQPAVLQVVILRDGLLVGTEVFVPGSYSVGSGPDADVKLDDASVDPIHAMLYFQNGRSAVQDNNSRAGLFVNGHRVKAVEVRSQDEILVGPFVLKTRVVQKGAAQPKPAPAPEVAALLKGTPPPQQPTAQPVQDSRAPLRPVGPPSMSPNSATVPSTRQQPAPQSFIPTVPGGGAAPQRPAPPPAAPQPPPPAGTVLSSRRAAALAAAPHLRPVEPAAPAQSPFEIDHPTENFAMPELPLSDEGSIPSTVPYAARGLSPKAAAPEDFEPSVVTDPGGGFGEEPKTVPAPRNLQAQLRRQSNPSMPKVAVAGAGKGPSRLYFELYWGDVRREARSFANIDPKKPVRGGAADGAAVPLWGFTLPEELFLIAEQVGSSYRVYVPPASVVEKQGAGATAFMPVSPRELESDGKRRFVTLSNGTAARFSEGEMSLVAYVAPTPEKVKVNPLAGMPWLVLSILFLLGSGFVSFILFGPKPRELPDFTAKGLPAVAVKLIAPEPEKKAEAAKKLEAIKKKAEAKKDTPKPVEKKHEEPKVVAQPKAPPPPETKALKALAKLSAAGPATNDVLAAIDKMGNGPGSKNAKNNFKLSGLVGKDPIANAGLGTFGLGGGGKGGAGTKGLEVLYGKGSGGIGAMGAGGFGKGGKIGGTVARANARQVSAAGNIDREAVAKVINSHFQEVRACYERALLKEPGLAGKAVLEWSITTSGIVGSAKTKNSTLRNGEVEGCILRAIKTWKFPPAKGGSVIITYPFLFNSVGY